MPVRYIPTFLSISEAERCVHLYLAVCPTFFWPSPNLYFTGVSSSGQQLGTSQLCPQLLCLLPLQVDMIDSRVDWPDGQYNNIMDTGDCSKLNSPRMTSSNLITSFIHDSFSALRSARHFCASSTNFPTNFVQFPHADLANTRQLQWNVVLGLLQYSDEHNLLLNAENHLYYMSQRHGALAFLSPP